MSKAGYRTGTKLISRVGVVMRWAGLSVCAREKLLEGLGVMGKKVLSMEPAGGEELEEQQPHKEGE